MNAFVTSCPLRAMNLSGTDRVNFAAYYIAAASARNLTCFWWDNHLFRGNGERFGLLDRKNAAWTYPDIVLAIQTNCLFNRE